MLRKSCVPLFTSEKVNGYAPEKVAFRPHQLQVNGYAPEKSGILSDYIHFYVLLWTNGHQKEAFSPLLATDYNPGILNGYAPEYVFNQQESVKRHETEIKINNNNERFHSFMRF